MNNDNENNFNKKYLNFIYEEDGEPYVTHIYFKNTFIYWWGKNKYGELGLGNTENMEFISNKFIYLIIIVLSNLYKIKISHKFVQVENTQLY